MYLIGADHPNKTACETVLDRLIGEKQRLVTDAEVFQEILHRYISINRREAIQPAFDVLNALVDFVFPISPSAVETAKNLVLAHPGTSARDALHVATMELNQVSKILTFDKGFRLYRGIQLVPTGSA